MTKRTAKQTGAYSRRKGATFERDVAAMVEHWSTIRTRRTPGSGSYGNDGATDWNLAGDLMLDPGSRVPLHFELKRREGWTWPNTLANRGPGFKWFKQANDDAKSGQMPVLLFKKNRGSLWIGLPGTRKHWFHLRAGINPAIRLNADCIVYPFDKFVKHVPFKSFVRFASDHLKPVEYEFKTVNGQLCHLPKTGGDNGD